MRINELSSLPSALTSGNVLAVDTSTGTYKIDYDALAVAVVKNVVQKFNNTINIDDVKHTCLAYCDGVTGTDLPTTYGHLICISNSEQSDTGTRCVQYLTSMGENTIWFRRYKDAWGGWANLVSQNVVPITAGGTGGTSKAGARVGIGIKYAIYNSVTDLGLTYGSATIIDAFDAMGDNAVLIAASDDFASSARPGGAAGVVEIIRKADSRSYIAFHGKTGTNSRDWRMFENATSYNGNRANAPDGVWHPDFAGLRGGTGQLGTTLAIDVPNSSSHLLICGGNGSTRQYVGLIFVNSSGAPTVTQILAGAAYTVTTATNKVTITSSSSGTELGFMCLPIRGNPFTNYTIT